MLLNKKLFLTPASSPVGSPSPSSSSSSSSSFTPASSKGKYKLGSKDSQQKLSNYKKGHQVSSVLAPSNYYNASYDINDEERTSSTVVNHKRAKTSGDYFTHKHYSESDSSDFNESDSDLDFDNSFTEYSLSFPKLNHKNSISKKSNRCFKANSRPTTPVVASAAPNDKKCLARKKPPHKSVVQQFHAKALDNISTKLNNFTYFIPSKTKSMMESSCTGAAVSNGTPQITNANSFSSSESLMQEMNMKNGKESKYNFYIHCDMDARERCFNYILETIDAVWARYCDATTLVEEEFYPTTAVNSPQISNNKTHKRSVSDIGRESSMDETLDNSTDVLDQKTRRRCSSIVSGKSISMMNNNNTMTNVQTQNDAQNNSATELEVDVNKLNHFKQRLSSTKMYMEDLVDSTDMLDLVNFWKKWDLIKYNCIQFMENDEDEYEDDIYDSSNYVNCNDQETQWSSFTNNKSALKPDSFDLCDEVLNKLEKGRYYYNNDDI
ncbi:hypothetical protein ACO0RG_001633 [Hanseniaspora osmophila]|uniref:Uncharacterized protein n=1 Tax=Hanseniaspora osmophila TaxID=56408 RepID=A0A1E5RHS2_9ASCO|nr:hypothetical protein AWRI3579_g1655 [Hanseniaspora osmophila]